MNLFDPVIMRGMGIGALVGFGLFLFSYALGVPLHWFRAIFWGAVVGGFAAYWPRFADLGAVITRKPEQRDRNFIIGVLSLIVLGVLLLLIMSGGGYLLTRCFPSLE